MIARSVDPLVTPVDNTPDLLPWPVPFAQARDPSVSLITEHGGDEVMLVVAPAGIDRYPKYTVRFQRVLTLLSFEEAYSFDRGYRSLSGLDKERCAYLWPNSPWIASYRSGAEVFGWKDLQHYLLFGGDSIVEILTAESPEVQQHDHKVFIEVKHEV